MTVTYSQNVANVSFFGFIKLLARWRGSVYKLVYKETIVFCLVYYILGSVYHYLLNPYQQIVFENVSQYCKVCIDYIPLSFILGFYIAFVIHRWWEQYLAFPFPDKLVMLISAYVEGSDERGRAIRRNLARYSNLMIILTLQAISIPAKKRFPTVDHLVDSGLITKEERHVYDTFKVGSSKWLLPAQWFMSLAKLAEEEGRISSVFTLSSLLEEFQKLRTNCWLLFSYDWIGVPLVYTQVLNFVIGTYFMGVLMGRQSLNLTKNLYGHQFDFYFPYFMILEFLFYMGLLKMAQQLINPFGEDDDAFEINFIIDRNFQMSLTIVDWMCAQVPTILAKDAYWNELVPVLPYTNPTLKPPRPYLGSAAKLIIDPSEFSPLETIKEVELPVPLKKEPFPSLLRDDAVLATAKGLDSLSDESMLNDVLKELEVKNSLKDDNFVSLTLLDPPMSLSHKTSMNEHIAAYVNAYENNHEDVMNSQPPVPPLEKEETNQTQEDLLVDLATNLIPENYSVPDLTFQVDNPASVVENQEMEKSQLVFNITHSEENLVRTENEPGFCLNQSCHETTESISEVSPLIVSTEDLPHEVTITQSSTVQPYYEVASGIIPINPYQMAAVNFDMMLDSLPTAPGLISCR